MPVVNGYLTEAEAREYIGRSDAKNPELLEDIVTAASRLIDRHCGRTFFQQSATARIFDSRDAYTVDFGPFNDLVSVTTVKTDENADGTFETTVSASTYQLLPVGATTKGPVAQPYTSLRMIGSAMLPTQARLGTDRLGLIEITGTWGWPAVPAEVKAACRIIVAEMAKLQDAPLGITGGDVMGVAYVGRRLPARAVDLLAPLRHPLNMGLA